MSKSANSIYQHIWKYLNNELNQEDSNKLESWLYESVENQAYFHEVLKDYNTLNSTSKEHSVINRTKLFYGIAASIAVIIISVLFFHFNQNPTKTHYTLADGTELILLEGQIIGYDSLLFAETGHIKVQGKVHIKMNTLSKHPISVETNSGFYIIEDADVIVESTDPNKSSLQLFSGKAELQSPDANLSNVELVSGESIIHDSKKNTINKNLYEEVI